MGHNLIGSDPTCRCGARARQGYFHMADANGWPVSATELAEEGRPGYREGQALWDGKRVVCSRCSAIYDSVTGEFQAYGSPPLFITPNYRSDEVGEEAHEQHLTEARLAKRLLRLLRRLRRAVA